MVSVKLGTNEFVSQISTALAGIPSYIACMLLMDRWGRKPICCFGSILCGIACISAAYVEGYIQLCLTMLGNLVLSAYSSIRNNII